MPPKGRDEALEVYMSQVRTDVEQSLAARRKHKAKDNLTAGERSALKALMAREDVVIKPADKGSGVVVLGKADYLLEAERQLGNGSHYRLLDGDPLDETVGVVAAKVHDLHARKIIDKHTQRFLLPREPRLARFYLLPKIHKPGNPGRPIVSSNNSPTENISQYVDHFLQPLVRQQPGILRDTTDFLNRLETLPTWKEGWLLVTLDVSSLYTNIPHEEGIEACRSVLNQRSVCDPPTEDLCSLIEVILTNNVFGFNNKCYHQVHGTAMGTKMAPAYANLFMSRWEQRFLDTQTTKPGVWWRFLDDIFSIWTHGRASLDTFLVAINQAHPTIKFTYNISEQEAVHLDTRVYVTEHRLETDLHTKPTDKHQYLHTESCHPPHTKSAIPYGQALRLRRICSEGSNLDKRLQDLSLHLEQRGYSESATREAAERAKSVPRTEALTQRPKEDEEMVPLVATYHPHLPRLQRILEDNKKILNTNHLQQAIPERYRVAFRRPKNLRDLLVSAEVSRPKRTDIVRGNQKCNGRGCKTCPALQEVSEIKSHSTGEGFKLHVSATCKSSDLVYVIACKRCGKQYVGETEQALHERMNSHRSDIRKKTKEKPVAAHFCSDGHTLSDFSVVVVDQLHQGDPVLRKNRESRWIRLLQTEAPKGINLRVDRL